MDVLPQFYIYRNRAFHKCIKNNFRAAKYAARFLFTRDISVEDRENSL